MSDSIQRLGRQNFRLMRAEQLAAAVMNHLVRQGHDFGEVDCRALHHAMLETFAMEGVEIVTDEIRRQAGLSPRGPDGWTLEEAVELERARLEALRRVPEYPVFWNDKLGGKSDE